MSILFGRICCPEKQASKQTNEQTHRWSIKSNHCAYNQRLTWHDSQFECACLKWWLCWKNHQKYLKRSFFFLFFLANFGFFQCVICPQHHLLWRCTINIISNYVHTRTTITFGGALLCFCTISSCHHSTTQHTTYTFATDVHQLFHSIANYHRIFLNFFFVFNEISFNSLLFVFVWFVSFVVWMVCLLLSGWITIGFKSHSSGFSILNEASVCDAYEVLRFRFVDGENAATHTQTHTHAQFLFDDRWFNIWILFAVFAFEQPFTSVSCSFEYEMK